MKLRKLLPWIAHACLILALLASLFAYFWAPENFVAYGSWAHQLSRTHALLVHLSIGTVLVLCALELFRKIDNGPRRKLHHLSHFLLAPAICTGLLMESAERYPNPAVANHLAWALAAYVIFFCFSLFVWTGSRRIQCAGAVVLALVLIQAARIGGSLHKGQEFFPW